VETVEEVFLFLVVLGGRAKKANIELHDVRWVVGSRIEDTFDALRNDWFGNFEGLHIDSYKKINYVDGYKLNLKKIENMKSKMSKFSNKDKSNKNLWFVNIGGYDPCSMQEKHEFGLVVASSSLEAINIAKSKWLIGFQKKHKDDIDSLEILIDCDDCKPIRKVGSWEIELIKDHHFIQENNYPDWYGYQKLEGK